MSRPSNQDIEHYYFELFQTHYALPKGDIEYSDKPDVIIHGENKLGIEIANVYLADGKDPTSEQQQRRYRKEVLDEAQKLYLLAGGENIELSFDFNPAYPIENQKALATELAHVAKSIDHLPSGSIRRDVFQHIPQVRLIYLNTKEYNDAEWRLVQGYSVPMLSIPRITEIVDGKNNKMKKYRACDGYWLLLVIDLMDSAQDQEIEWPSSKVISSNFDKVIIYKPQFGEVVEVPIHNESS